MQKLTPVEEARELMIEAMDWSAWRWLMEKRRVRAAADRAVEALTKEEKKVKAGWSIELRKAYREMAGRAAQDGCLRDLDPQVKQAIRRVKDADEAAETARLDAEATFEEAERRLSSSMAKEGAQKAIDSWDLREKAIRRAEAVARRQADSADS